MKLSILLLVIDLILWVIVMFSYVITNELAISPLSYIKRNLLVNISKRKLASKLLKKDDEDKEAVKEVDTTEEDHANMKKLEKIIFKFRFKYIILFLILVILTLLMMFILPIAYPNDYQLDISTYVVSICVTDCIVYVLTKFMAQREDMKEKSYDIIAKKLRLDDKLMDIIKENTK